MRTFHRILRILSAATLFFFCWAYLPIYSLVAYAATNNRTTASRSAGIPQQVPQDSGGRFEKLLDDIHENIGKTDEKAAKNVDTAAEIEVVKAKRAEVDLLDAELKKEFADTEKKLRGANLPQEILDRHAEFVKHYDDNLTELKANLDALRNAKTKVAVKVALQKAKTHLEKVKPPKKHIRLDPNKLPHRTVKAKKRAPRLKKEEFEKEFGPQSIPGGPKTADGRMVTDFFAASERNWVRTYNKPILLAFNGPVSDMPLSLGSRDLTQNSQLTSRNTSGDSSFPAVALNSVFSTTGLALTQATNPPTPADLAETIEVQFTPAIAAKALELGNNPIKIYEWVRNNVEFVPTYGSIQGANMCLRTKQCNAFDTSSLVIALLRASNIPAKYVYGTIEVPIDKVMNWVGGFTDPATALNMIASGGIPAKGLTMGGKVVAAQLEHVWVEAWVDYIPSRGAVHRQGDTWIPLDASFKQYNYYEGTDMSAALTSVGLDMEAMINDANTSAVKDEVNLSATSVSTSMISGRLDVARTDLFNYFKQTSPDANVNDILGHRAIRQQKVDILPASLPLSIVAQPVRFAAIPASLQHSITIRLVSNDFFSEDAFSTVLPLPSVSSSQITLSYFPASAADEQIATNYGGILKTPAYLLQLKAFLKVGGTTRASGGIVALGNAQKLQIQFTGPGSTTDAVEHDITAGGYYAITLDVGSMAADQLYERKAKLREIIQAGQATKDDSLGQILYTWGLSYFLQARMFEVINSRTLGVVNVKIGSEGLVGTSITVETLFGLPRSTSFAGFTIDVKRDTSATFAKDGNKEKVKAFMFTTGLYGSSLENGIFEETMKTQGVSAAKLLRVANDTGIPIYFINKTNIGSILPKLSLPAGDINDMQNAVNAGKIVYTPQRTINYGTFSGIGYMVLDPESGAGAYLISGGLGVLHGGSAAADPTFQSLVTVCNFVRDTLAVLLSLVGSAAGVMADLAALIGDTFTGLMNGTASGSDIALSIAIWAAATAFSLWLASQTLPLVLAAAIFGGSILGPIGAIIGAVVAVLLIVAIQVAMYFLVKYLTDTLLLSWLRDILIAMKSLLVTSGDEDRSTQIDNGAPVCLPA